MKPVYVIEVRMWGSLIGAVAPDPRLDCAPGSPGRNEAKHLPNSSKHGSGRRRSPTKSNYESTFISYRRNVARTMQNADNDDFVWTGYVIDSVLLVEDHAQIVPEIRTGSARMRKA